MKFLSDGRNLALMDLVLSSLALFFITLSVWYLAKMKQRKIMYWRTDDTSGTSSKSTTTNQNIGWRQKSKGRVRSAIMLFLVPVIALSMIAVPASIALAKYFSRYPTYEIGDESNLVQVLRYDQSSQKYEFHYKGIDFWMKLCEKPPFDPGDFLKLYKYEDRGSCASLDGEWTAVLIRRNEHGKTDSEANNERER